MVTYRQFVRLFAEVRGGGADEAAPVWNDNKAALQAATESDVRQALRG